VEAFVPELPPAEVLADVPVFPLADDAMFPLVWVDVSVCLEEPKNPSRNPIIFCD